MTRRVKRNNSKILSFVSDIIPLGLHSCTYWTHFTGKTTPEGLKQNENVIRRRNWDKRIIIFSSLSLEACHEAIMLLILQQQSFVPDCFVGMRKYVCYRLRIYKWESHHHPEDMAISSPSVFPFVGCTKERKGFSTSWLLCCHAMPFASHGRLLHVHNCLRRSVPQRLH